MRNGQAKMTAQTGFSLVEVMVAMTLGLVLLAGVTSLVVSMSRSHSEVQKQGELFDNGRYGTSLLAEEIRHAGFYGRYDEPQSSASLTDPCSGDTAPTLATIEDNLQLAIFGYDSPSTATPDCIADADHVDNTDILVVRRASRQPTAVGSLEEGRIYFQGGVDKYNLAKAASSTSNNKSSFDLFDDDGNRIPIRALRIDVYFASPCEAKFCANAPNDVPSLKREQLTVSGTTPAFERVVLSSGVGKLQFDYGIDYNDDGQPDSDTSGTSNPYTTDPSTVSKWTDTVTAEIHALSRARDPSSGYTNSQSYDMGLDGGKDTDAGPYNDAYKRHLFSRIVRVVNRSSRREEP